MKFVIATVLLLTATLARSSNSFLELLKSYSFDSHDIRRVPLPIHREYDFVIVGAGSGGSTVANRLSENPNWRVILLEAGRAERLIHQIPMLVSTYQRSDYNWGYRVEPQKHACFGMNNHQCTWPRGKSLGGSSTLNYMIHTRGNKLDYDEWALNGNDGWSYEEVLPYFKKSERFKVAGVTNSSYHGTDGHLCVERAPYHTELATQFLKAGEQSGYRIIDYNGEDQVGFSYLQVNMDRGARCSASKAYLSFNKPNLEIVTNAQVTKILVDKKKRAYGVEYVKYGLRRKVRATKEVILSAGTIDSAKLLMLSGIGPREHLAELGIELLKDSKVGYNLYEHIGFLGLVFMVNQSVTLMANRVFTPPVIFRYVADRSGPLSVAGGAEAIAFLKSKYASSSRPDVELLFVCGSLHGDNELERKAHGVSDELYDGFFKPIENKDAWSIWPIVQKPQSHGRVKLKSNNPFDAPLMEPNFFTHPADIEIILEGIKHAINISRTEAFRGYDTKLYDTKVPGCERHNFASDDYWRCAIRYLPAMMNHEIGTVKMGPKSDPDAVVDPQLRVYGIDRLRVVDASIMPTMPVGHVNAGIYMIGEKASDMIKQTWKNPPRYKSSLRG